MRAIAMVNRQREIFEIMIAHRIAILLVGATTLATFHTQANAQVPDDVVLNIMRECARIDEPSARLACYDNNIRSARATPRNTVPGETVVLGSGAVLNGPNNTGPSSFGIEDVQGSGVAASSLDTSGSAGFGRENIQSYQAPQGELQELSARVAGVRQVGPGLYVITLEDGAVWRFTDGVSPNYRAPSRGSEVEISRASMGSFLLRFEGQQSVRVERER